MTLVLAAMTPEKIWLLTDRRLTRGRQVVSDDAVKIMLLTATDGNALLGYAGLGRTAAGTEPAQWMGDVLGSQKMTVETALGKISAAMERQMPRHITGLAFPHHAVFAPAFINKEHRVYVIELGCFGRPPRRDHRYIRYLTQKHSGARRTTFALGGTGGVYLKDTLKGWSRDLRRVLRANEREVVPDLFVARCLAKINLDVHRALKDKTVGPNCIVAWRHRNGFGSHASFAGTTHVANPKIPSVGADVGLRTDLVHEIVAPSLFGWVTAKLRGEEPPRIDGEEIGRHLREIRDQLHPKPKEELK